MLVAQAGDLQLHAAVALHLGFQGFQHQGYVAVYGQVAAMGLGYLRKAGYHVQVLAGAHNVHGALAAVHQAFYVLQHLVLRGAAEHGALGALG